MKSLFLLFLCVASSCCAKVSEEMLRSMSIRPGELYTVRYGNARERNWSYRVFKILKIEGDVIQVCCYTENFKRRPKQLKPTQITVGLDPRESGHIALSEAFFRRFLPRRAGNDDVTEAERRLCEEWAKSEGLLDDIVVEETKKEIDEVRRMMKKKEPNQSPAPTAPSGRGSS